MFIFILTLLPFKKLKKTLIKNEFYTKKKNSCNYPQLNKMIYV